MRLVPSGPGRRRRPGRLPLPTLPRRASVLASSAWAALPAALREVAELRLRYPYLSLQELAGRANPPLSKSALNHRLRRLAALAGELDP